ncbi:MAG TPA: hypothetical protein ENJ95_15355 [Bacteroidetes bacterium]|nr:hypothetical protein [Bacteroidota bacterium]
MKYITLTFSFCFLLALAALEAQDGHTTKVSGAPVPKTYAQHLEEAKKQHAALSLKLIQTRIAIADREAGLRNPSNSDGAKDGQMKLSLPLLKTKEGQLEAEVQAAKSWLAQLKEMEHWPEGKRLAAIETSIRGQGKIFQTQQAANRGRVPERDVLLDPPSLPCELSAYTNGKEKSRHTKPQLLFGFTNKKLEEYYPDRDFITCYGSLAMATGGIKTLNLGLVIATYKAQKIYGKFQKGDFLFLHFLDGTKVALVNRKPDLGRWDSGSAAYLFEGQYVIGAREEQLLRSKLLDKVTVQWSKVQDEFEIFELDFFINHFECLESG